MSGENLRAGVNRRDFLKAVGVATGAAAAFPLQAGASLLTMPSPEVSVGVLLPASAYAPEMGTSIVSGMRLFARAAGWTGMRLTVAETGGNPARAIARAEQLLGSREADLLVGVLNPLLLADLRRILARNNSLFINLEGGANAFTEEHPAIFHNSLGYWEANYAMGTWAAANMGKRACVVTSFYESGYDSAYAFRQGFEAAGGTIIRSEVTHIPPRAVDFSAPMRSIAAARPDFVYAISSGQEAVEFIQAYADAGLVGTIPLAASGFMVDEAHLAAMGSAALGVKSCLSWAPGLGWTENRAFQAGFLTFAGRPADAFAVLGYETARMIHAAVTETGGEMRGSARLLDAVQASCFPSPRGPFAFNRLGQADTPLYVREVRREGGVVHNAVLAELPRISHWERLATTAEAGVKTGWLHGYLCV